LAQKIEAPNQNYFFEKRPISSVRKADVASFSELHFRFAPISFKKGEIGKHVF
jgi:hypothetical protein